MTPDTTKVDQITFLKKNIDVDQNILDRKQFLRKIANRFSSAGEKGLYEYVQLLSESISKKDLFLDFPGNQKFPYNLNGLSSHLLFTSAMIKFILKYFIAEKGFNHAKVKLGIDFDISEENLYIIGRFIGLMYDIIKSGSIDLEEGSVPLSKEILNIIEVPQEWVNFIPNIIEEYYQENDSELFVEILVLSNLLATSEGIPFTNLYFMETFLNRNEDINNPFVNNQKFMQTLQKYNRIIKQEEVSKVDDHELLEKLKNIKVKSNGKEIPYFISSNAPKAIIERIKSISEKGDFPLNKPCVSFLDLSFKSKQNFIFKGARLKRIIGGSLLIQLFEDIFYEAFINVCSPELIITKGGGELLGIVPISVTMEEIKTELERQIHNRLQDFEDQLENEKVDINRLKNLLIDYVRIKYSRDYKISLFELRYGRDLENEPEKSYDYSYYYEKYQEGTQKEKKTILNYFLHPTKINKIIRRNKYNSLDELVEKWSPSESEFFIEFQERKSFGEVIGNFYDSVIEKNALPKANDTDPDKEVICAECHEKFENPNKNGEDEESITTCDICRFCNILTNSMQELEDFPTQRLFEKIKDIIRKNENIRIESNTLLNLDKLSTPSIESENSTYLGFIRLDGNNFGMIKSYMKTFSSYKAFSRFIANKTEEMLLQACKKTINEWSRNPKIHGGIQTPLFRFFIVGGDDISLALHSELALSFIQNFFEQIRNNYGYKVNEKQLKTKIGNEPVTIYPTGFSGGLIITHTKVPFNILNNCANYLEHKAKEFIKPQYSDPLKNLYGGSINSVAPIFVPQGITKNYIRQYYEHNLIPNFTFCEFPLDDDGFEKLARKINEVLSSGISSSSFKSIYREGLKILPLELNMQLYYKAGRESNDNQKAEFWSKLAKTLSNEINNFKENDKYQNKYNNKILLKWFEPIELSRFKI
jgi:hypothetical protein